MTDLKDKPKPLIKPLKWDGKWACLYVLKTGTMLGVRRYSEASHVKPSVLHHASGQVVSIEKAKELNLKSYGHLWKDLLYWQPYPVKD